jgi:hypothetical protein
MSTKSMTTAVDATFEIKNWVEQNIDDLPVEFQINRAVVTKRYHGAIRGTSLTEWVMSYVPDGSARFVGMERIEGFIDGRSGTFVLQHVGTFRDGVAKGTVEVVPGAGTDDLAGVTGQGALVADPAGSLKLDLAFD